MAKSLKQKTIGALFWNFADRFGQQILQFAVMIIVANILFPDDYALVAMLAVFTAIGNLIVESGFGAALIQKKDATDKDFSSVFWFNLVMSFMLYLLFMASMPLIVDYFNEPRLFALSIVVFLNMPVNASMLIQSTLFNKQVRFKELAKIDLLAMLVSSVVAVVMALSGCGVWTLAWQPVVLASSKSIALWKTSKWRPLFYFDFGRIRRMSGFASNLLLSGLLNNLFLNVYSLVVPKMFQKRDLGFVTQSNKVCDPVVNLIYGSIQTATYPVYSNIQDERGRLINAYRKSIRFTAFLTFPLLLGLMTVAPPLFKVLFKPEWWFSVPYFRLLCLGGCFTVLSSINGNFIRVSGKTRPILTMEIYKILLTVAVIFLFRQSALAFVAGIVGVRFFVYLLNLIYTHRYTGYHFGSQIKDTVPYLVVGAVMVLLTNLWSFVLTNHLILLFLEIITGILVYLSLIYLGGSHILKEAIDIIKHYYHGQTES